MGPVKLKWFARMGYGARGIVYLIIGGLALLAALGAGGETTDAKGALEELLSQPLGHALLAAMAIGLFGYAGWRLVQSLLDADGHGTDLKGIVVRAGLFTSAITHSALAFYALTLAIGTSFSQGGNGGLAAWLMGQPYGVYLVGAVGVVIIGAGLSQAWKGASRKYEHRLSIGDRGMSVVSPICAFGLLARGLAFCIVGGLFVYAAVHVDPTEAGGLEDALRWLRSQPAGPFLFAAVSVGLIAFGLYSLIEAIWRDIEHSRSNGASVLPEKPAA